MPPRQQGSITVNGELAQEGGLYLEVSGEPSLMGTKLPKLPLKHCPPL